MKPKSMLSQILDITPFVKLKTTCGKRKTNTFVTHHQIWSKGYKFSS